MKNISPILRSKKQARQFYDRMSGKYDWLTYSEKPLIRKGVEALSPLPGEHILEIGCGTGTGMALMNQAIHNSERSPNKIFGLDISHQMLLISQEKTNANLIQGDAANLPLKASAFDALFCSFTLELFSEADIPIILQSFHRALKPNGRLVVIALVKPPENVAVKIYEFAHRLFPVAIDCRPIPLKDILINNGFQIASEARFMNWGLPVERVLCFPA
jgi:ubiquinone/menaquinone biosynthesis C-methylase UbiE